MRESTIRRLIKIVEESDVESLEISRFFQKIRITKKINSNGHGPTTSVLIDTPAQPTTTPPPATIPTPEPTTETEKPSNMIEIASPMVGTFYSAPSPDSDPFVQSGTRVSTGDTVCIIEAMKLMNEIEAEVTGVIKQILVENGEPVEYGQPLFYIEPN